LAARPDDDRRLSHAGRTRIFMVAGEVARSGA
jgi:hypothetical protein